MVQETWRQWGCSCGVWKTRQWDYLCRAHTLKRF